MNAPIATTTRGSTTARDVLVDASWLAEHVDDANVRVVEVDVSPDRYTEGHIDGAALWNVYADLKDREYRPIDIPALERLLARSGISRDSTVVFYGYAPALAFWLMKLHRHGDVRILDCSRETWRAAGQRWSTRVVPPAESSYRLGAPDPRLRADAAAVRDAIGRSGTSLLDVRSEAEYRGERFWPSGGMERGAVAGHVPSAVHQPIDDVHDENGAYRDADTLLALFAGVDLADDTELITYCTIGGRAATAWFALRYLLGREHVRVYDGSWAEWGRLAGSSVDTARDDVPLRGQRPVRVLG